MAQTPPGDVDLGQWLGWVAAAILAAGVFFRDRLFPFWAKQRESAAQHRQRVQELEQALEAKSRDVSLELQRAEQAHDQRAEDAILKQVLDTQRELVDNLIKTTISQRERVEGYVYQSTAQSLREEQQAELQRELFAWIQKVEKELAEQRRLIEEISKRLRPRNEPGVHDTQERKIS